MTVKNATLKDKSGNTIHPITKGLLVLNNNSENLGGVEAGAQVNTIEGVQIASSDLTPDSSTKKVNIPVASADTYGVIKAEAKTSSDTQEVKIDATTGKLYTAPGGGGVSVTKAQYDTLVANSQLIPGTIYNITDDVTEDIIPDATSSVKGVMKLYDTVGANTDGAMTQASIESNYINSSNYLPAGTVITVGASGADFTNLQDALTYLSDKWSNGEITISLNAGTYSINDGIVIGDINYVLNIEGHSVDNTIISLSADKEFLFKIIGSRKTNIINFNNVELTSSITQTNCNGIWVDNLSTCNVNNIKITNVSSGLICLNGGKINCLRNGVTSINVSNRGFLVYGATLCISQTHNVTVTATNFGIQVSQGGYCIANGNITLNATNPLNQTKGQFTENGYISGQGV